MNPQQHQQLKNKRRLIAQNRKLYSEISKLEEQMSLIIEKRAQSALGLKQQTPALQSQRQEIVMQEQYLKKLKNKISHLKSMNTQNNSQYIRKQQDDLIFLKSQLESYLIQRQTLTKIRQDKIKALQKNSPLDQHKAKIEQQMIKVRKQNKQMLAKVNVLQKEIRKYHQVIQISKSPKINIENPDYQLVKIQHNIQETNRKLKEIAQKWQPQFDSLDSELFQLKDILIRKKNKLEELQRELKGWQIRISGVRQENDVIVDRARVAKVPQLAQGKRIADILQKISQNTQQKRKNQRSGANSPKKIVQLNLQSKSPSEKVPQKIIDDKPLIKQNSVKQKEKQKLKQKQQTKLITKQSKEIKQKIVNQPKQTQQKNKLKSMIEQKNKGVITQNSKDQGKTPQKSNPRSQTYSAQKISSKHGIRSQRKWLNKKQGSPNKNQFLSQDPQNIKVRQKVKQKKILKNIGIGTSFYYQD